MILKKLFVIGIIGLNLVLSSTAQEKLELSIDEMLKFAIQNNYDIKEAKLNKSKSELSIKEVKANGLPKVDAEVDYKNYLSLPSMILPGEMTGIEGAPDIITQFGKTHNLDASVQYSQLLFSLKYINSLKATRKALEIRELEVSKSEEELIQLLYAEYYNLLAIYKNLEIIESNMESLQLNRNSISAMVNEGIALQTDLDKIDINYANLEASKENVMAGINIQTNNLKFIIGMKPETELVVDTLGFSKSFNSIEFVNQYSSVEFDPENLIEIALLNKKIELDDSQINIARSNVTPTIALYGSYMYQAQREEFDMFQSGKEWFDVNVIGVKMTIPIFAGLGNRAKISTAKIDKTLTQEQLYNAEQGLNLQYQNALLTYQTSMKNCIIQKDNVELAARVKKQEEVKYMEGMGTLTDYLISETDYRNTQINYVQNLLSMRKAEIDLIKAKGLLRSILD